MPGMMGAASWGDPYAAMLAGLVVTIGCGAVSVALLAVLMGALDGRLKLAASVAVAMKRADMTQDYVQRVTQMSGSKLSDQLAGKDRFTGLCRILESDEIQQHTDFWIEWLSIQAEAHGRVLLPKDHGVLLAKVDRLLDGLTKPMVKAGLLPPREEQAS